MQEVADVLNRIKLIDWNLLQAHMADAKQDVVERQALIDKLYSEKMDDLEMNKRRMQELQREKVKENEELESNIHDIEDKQRKLAEAESQRQKRLRDQEEKLAKMRASGLSQEEINQMMEKYKNENKKLLEKEPEKAKLQYQLERPPKIYEPHADIESNLRLAGKEAGRSGEDVIDLLLRKIRKVEEIVSEVDTKHFEQAMKSLNQLNELIAQVRAR